MATWGECAHPAPLHPAPLGSLASRSPMQNAWTLTPLRQVLLHSSSSRVSFRKKVHKMSSYCVREGNILLLFCLVIIEQSLLSFLSLFFWRKNFYILQLCMTTSTRRVGLLNWKAVQYFVLRKQQHRHTLFWSELTVTELRTLIESLSDQYVTYITSEYKCWRQGFLLYRVHEMWPTTEERQVMSGKSCEIFKKFSLSLVSHHSNFIQNIKISHRKRRIFFTSF